MAQKAQEVAGGGLVAENLREELDDCKTEQQVGQTPSCRVRQSQGELNSEGAGRGSTVADPIQIWVLHMGNHSPTKAESLQAERYFRFTRSSAGLSCHRSIDSLLNTHLRHRRGDKLFTFLCEQWEVTIKCSKSRFRSSCQSLDWSKTRAVSETTHSISTPSVGSHTYRYLAPSLGKLKITKNFRAPLLAPLMTSSRLHY